MIYTQALGSRLATLHLIDLGHRQIAEISGPFNNYDGRDRQSAWQGTLRENGLPSGTSLEGALTTCRKLDTSAPL